MKKAQIRKIIFIIVDTLRAKSVGLYGAIPSPTPHIDAWSKSGVVFTNAYASITKTDPSISSIMTGKYPVSLGLVNHGRNIRKEEEESLNGGISFLSERMQAHGYKTMAIDWLERWHKRGYDYYSGKIRSESKDFHLVLDKVPFFFYARVLDKMLMKVLKRDFFLSSYYSLFPKAIIPYDPADVVIQRAIELLKKNVREKIFLYIHLWDAHMPHTRSKGLKAYTLDGPVKRYHAEVTFLDQELGRLIRYLDSSEQLDDTLIVLTADHGENFYDHGRPFNHEGLYDDVVKIPLILTHKLLLAKRISSLVQHVDVVPTVLDLLEIPIPENIDGKSLVPMISGATKKVRDFVYFEDIIFRRLKFSNNTTRRRGIRAKNFKYIQTLKGEEKKLYNVIPYEDTPVLKEELYDMKHDPLEKENVIEKKPFLKKRLREKIEEFVSVLNAKRLDANPDFKEKVERSMKVIKDASKRFNSNEIALAWTGGKDSTVLLHLVRSAFVGKIPFRVMFNDSTMEFEEIYKFIEKVAGLWNIKLITIQHSKKELEEFYRTDDHDKRRELSRTMKITAINNALKKYKFNAFIGGIRWDEHEARSRETYFSKRSDHTRIHPLLHFTEEDIWKYVRFFGVPYVALYDKGYRSLGEKPFTRVAPRGGGERSGREQDKEQLMARLRKLGYW